MKKSFVCFLLSVFSVTFAFATSNQEVDSDFDTFLKSFTSSAEFQYSRIKFPLNTPIYLIGPQEEEIEVPFTADEWFLLGPDDFRIGTFDTEDGIVFGKYTTKNNQQVVFESGLEESEQDLLITFDLIDGKWYVTDCYVSWYGGVRAEDFDAVVYEVQQLNADFMAEKP